MWHFHGTMSRGVAQPTGPRPAKRTTVFLVPAGTKYLTLRVPGAYNAEGTFALGPDVVGLAAP